MPVRTIGQPDSISDASHEGGDGNEHLSFGRAVLRGLNDTPRWLPCRFLYDAEGSRLFEQITEQPEYYLTRAESNILERKAHDIATRTGPVALIELGSGSSSKTDHLLVAYARAQPVEYIPIDVSDTAIAQAAHRIREQHDRVCVRGIVGTYEEAFSVVADHSPALVLFLGSTIGNFNQTESLMFWRRVSDSLADGDFFLLGADLVKDERLLNAAYNDRAGVTARFTKNLFTRMNRELGSEIDVSTVEHVAHYNIRWQRIETFARFTAPQTIDIGPLGLSVSINAGAEIMIEISRKFVLSDLSRFLQTFGLETIATYTDDGELFGDLLLRKTG